MNRLACLLAVWGMLAVLADLRSEPAADDKPIVDLQAAENGNGNGKEKEKEREHMKDNSFLIEEAYNQEQGIVQHIFNWTGYWTNSHGYNRQFGFLYTMEVPLGSEKHQFSLQFPMEQFVEIGPAGGPGFENGGLADLQLNYRYQLFMDEEDSWQPAVAPRVSLILPTGDKTRGLGNGEYGFQFGLPISKQIEPFAFHFNAGYTSVPDVSLPIAAGLSTPRNLNGYNVGASVIWLASYDVNLMLEWVTLWNEDVDDFDLRDRTVEMVINPAVRVAVYTADEIQWVLGIGVPIGLSNDAPDIGIFGYMSVEHRAKKEKK